MISLPQCLMKGDTIGIVAPSGAPPDADAFPHFAKLVRSLGYRCQFAKNIRRKHGYLAGSDESRAHDLMEMFVNPKVKAILCLGGGYGTARILGQLDYDKIRANSKILAGCGDITALQCALLKKSALPSIYSPIVRLKESGDKIALTVAKNLLKSLGDQKAGKKRPFAEKIMKAAILRTGKASGRLIGGDLTTICSLIGTPFQPSFKDAILFFEVFNEAPYRIDRLLNQLALAGILGEISGVIIGKGKPAKIQKAKEYKQTAEDVFRERLLPLKIPVITNVDVGHRTHGLNMPIGADVTFDTKSPNWLTTIG